MTTTSKRKSIKNIWALTVATLGWFSIGFQFYITDLKALNFFSYFTTLCNLLIAVSLTISTLVPSSRTGLFFSRLSVQSAIALYIFIVSLVYNLALRGIWILTGWEFFLDNMVHVVVPILYILYWLLFRTAGTLAWKDGLTWIFFPLLYLLYSLVRGSILQWYPYPFLDATKLGYHKVFVNISIMLAAFLVGGFILISTTRSTRNKAP